MFCNKCGCKVSDNAGFCPRCGAQIIRPEANTAYAGYTGPKKMTDSIKEIYANNSKVNTIKEYGKKVIQIILKRKAIAIAIAAAIIIPVVCVSNIKYTCNEPCWWCDETPTMKLVNFDSEDVYICKDCASECFYCGEKADRIEFNMLGGPLPMCNECYSEETGD